MRRAPLVLAATAAGLAATLGFHPHAKSSTPATAVATAPAPKASSSGRTVTNSGKTVTSDVADTQYGPVQLKVTISGGKITDIQPVQLPSTDPKSVEIANYAAPQLRQSALSAQSTNVDTVSGATYTSEGYRTALQSALDKTGLRTPAGA
jgi:uncharacterized protein with FMN-binding domain